MIDFTGHAAVMSGAGRGLGRLCALDLARRGASVVVNDLGGTMHGAGADSSVADDVVAEITAAGGEAVASYASVDSPEGGQAIVDASLEAFGRLDVVGRQLRPTHGGPLRGREDGSGQSVQRHRDRRRGARHPVEHRSPDRLLTHGDRDGE